MIFLCINNKVTNKFVYYKVSDNIEELRKLADKLGIEFVYTHPASFAQFAVEKLTTPKMDIWHDELDVDNNDDPWDIAKLLRSNHAEY